MRSPLLAGIYKMAVPAAALMAVAVVLAAHFVGWGMGSVQSDSMYPAIQKGAAVLLERQKSSLRPGDIITYRSPLDTRVTITHRVVSVADGGRFIRAKGDNVLTADPLVPASAVVGRVEYVVPYAGYVLDALRSPLGIALLVYLPCLGIIIGEIRRLRNHYAGQAEASGVYHLYGYRS